MSLVNKDSQLESYLSRLSDEADSVLEDIALFNKKMPEGHMQIPAGQGQFMTLLLQAVQAKCVLEIGTYTGYSGLCLLRGLAPGGHFYACDTNPEWTKQALKFWKQAGYTEQIHLIRKEAHQLLLEKNETQAWKLFFDAVFVDARKGDYAKYYDLLKPMVKSGGLLLFDNVLWRGEVQCDNSENPIAAAMQSFNLKVKADPDVQQAILPIGDGMMLIYKKP